MKRPRRIVMSANARAFIAAADELYSAVTSTNPANHTHKVADLGRVDRRLVAAIAEFARASNAWQGHPGKREQREQCPYRVGDPACQCAVLNIPCCLTFRDSRR